MGQAVMGVVLSLLAVAASAAEQKGPPGKPGKGLLNQDEQALLDLVNKERAKEKLPPLKVNPKLCLAARGHTANMVKHDKMAHRLEDKGVGDRVTAAGYEWRSVRENLARSPGDPDVPAPKPEAIHKMWMDSKGHRANILDDKVTEIGLAMARSKKGTYYYTQVFAAPAK